MTKKILPESYPLPELIDVELSENAKHYELGQFDEMLRYFTDEIVHFLDTHSSVEIDIDKVESFSTKSDSEGLDILVRLSGDPIE